ncbi:indolepyruvate ferredoxin oxidoreductase, alpha subunit [Thermosulfidibacter takaii ABI70S6]|uniref:Indolepyruvate oxidoreductase subunit IorA n=1 Tax=Thermosulfidibacter takaii (strain DSM 17441 / JCM 13301 / NBRC 103674 / ABI70S6) TaxID=1298851 RepID=A0A0S3QSE8_THET7|nr:indolepyruvate ferredoxin oxidoreductase subunit alpha [Thermosulfidibacter takaii]BAT71263.1 indolepyruvate ferredoxin oxidoreductase, alpha subunit [Thermosulfidibacter takaii ABI70S6]
MKRFLSGNEAVARGAWEAGLRFASSYPGTPATEILQSLVQYKEVHAEWAPNEKVALESAIGASFAGVRSMASMKHVGLNVAADPFMTLAYTGVNAGLVLAVADDPGLYSSQNEQDTRNYVKAARILALEPSDSQEALDYTKKAFELSERYDIPVLIRLTTRISHSKSVVKVGDRIEVGQKEPQIEPAKWVMLPAYAKGRHLSLLERHRLLKEFVESSEADIFFKEELLDESVGFIASGVCYQYVKEAFPEASVFKLGIINPLPFERLKSFADKLRKVYVVEELDPVIEEQLKAFGLEVVGKEIFPENGEFTPDVVKKAVDKDYKPKYVSFNNIPARPPTLCPGCPHRGVFVALKKARVTVFGDIGCYTLGALPPLSSIHSCVCMGAGVSMVHGANVAGLKKSVAIIGDSTFLHSGVTSLMNIIYNKSTSTVIIMDNGTTAMTGKQPHPGTGVNAKGEPTNKVDLEALVKTLGVKRVRVVDPYDVKATYEAIKEEVETEEPSVVITRRPCTLIVQRPSKGYKVDADKCISCGACMRVGCMAISMNGSASIDEVLCFGCGVCVQVCPVDAISEVNNEN